MELVTGLKGRAETTVDSTNTAAAAGSGTLQVFGTPFMAALMEKAASDSLQQTLEPGKSSVGTQLSLRHSSATPVGMRVWAESIVTVVDGRKISFSVTAFDEAGEIGSGEHERVIIDSARFMERCQAKLNNKND